MQSFRQYRHAGKAVAAEHERYKQRPCQSNKQEKRASRVPQQTPYTHPTEEVEDPAAEKDLEKGDSDTESTQSGGQRRHLHDDEDNCLHDGIHPVHTSHMDPEDEEAKEYAVHPSVHHRPTPVNPDSDNPPRGANDTLEQRSRSLSRRRLEREPTAGTALGHTFTGVDVRDRTTNEGKGTTNPKTGHPTSDLVFVVGFQGPKDPLNPHNWSTWTRIGATAMIAAIGFVVGLASSIDSSALVPASEEFGVSTVTESLATGLYLIGFGAGALFAGPFSETFGRNPVYISTLFLYMVFVMATGLAPNIGAQLAFRFIAGFFGATPLVCAGGSISDLWSPIERVYAFPVFAVNAFTGPLFGPVIGGFVVQSEVLGNWRWCDWFTLIISGLVFGLVVLFQPETYPNTLLKWRAEHLRRVTGDCRYRAQIEVRSEGLGTRLTKALYRPFILTFQEPIILLIATYLTIIYIILFTFLDGYTYIFDEPYNLGDGLTGTCFLGIIVGLLIAACLTPYIYKKSQKELKKAKEEGKDRLPPEFRLWWAMLGGAFAIPISLFWMGWTSNVSKKVV